ncbi:MAG: hypothetical protein ABR569_04005 [Gaiellaceae bacterium]
MPSRLALALVAVPAACLVGASSAPAATPHLEQPARLEIGRMPRAVSDRTLPASSRSARASLPVGAWGGVQTASTGDRVILYASASYPQDPAELQRWADFLASLVHGAEISNLTMYLAPLPEVQQLCGPNASACYGESLLVAPGEDLPDGTSTEAVVTHEYGHHVAASRDDAPWAAVDWGTKRWATYEAVCPRANTSQLFPGDEGVNYRRNPGEAFAESYRVLNERMAGVDEAPWQVVDRLLYPDDQALALLEQDILEPWAPSAPARFGGSLTRAKPSRTLTVGTSLDGTFRVTLHAPPKARYSLVVLTLAGAAAGRATTSAGGSVVVRATVCGTRTYRLKVTRIIGAGTYSMVVSKP